MSELQQAREKIKKLEELNNILHQLVDAKDQARILIRQKMEHQEQELKKIKVVTRYIWN